jgi:hypothetical protein
MGVLRSKIESRIENVARNSGDVNSAKELSHLLALVKNAELILKEVSQKAESARFLEEFIMIVNGAEESVSEVKSDIEALLPAAEDALANMNNAVSQISTIFSSAAKEEIDPSILAQITAEIAIKSEQDQIAAKSENQAKVRLQAEPQEAQEKLEEQVAI